ncbi:MAG: hypothetical protein BRD52_05170 [Bacteroidetes bacterium SW_4_67_19]|nr:MAG: hypothetical protein BRD52_05170 [Bacteroidetes bacterium SW_4_67_19]
MFAALARRPAGHLFLELLQALRRPVSLLGPRHRAFGEAARVSFTFRGERFRLRHRADGSFSYARLSRDSLGRRVEDVLTSSGTLRRRIDGRSASLDSAARRRIETAVNSVAYFALLPFPLGDPAVQPRYAGTDTLRGTPYHRIAVRFRQQGGGRDWQDRFLYWFDQRDFSMDYLAYAYGLGNGEDYGTRFRDAFNVRTACGSNDDGRAMMDER